MLNIDAKGILKNTGRITPIFPGESMKLFL